MGKRRRHLGEILYKAGLVEKQAIVDAIKTSKTKKQRIGEVLIGLGLINEETLSKAIAKQFGLEYINLDKITIPKEAANLVPEELIKNAVKGMLSKNKLGRQQFKKLKVYVGSDHPHAAQQPEQLDI